MKFLRLPIESVESVSWNERQVELNLSRAAIRERPEWNPDLALSAYDELNLGGREPGKREDRTERQRLDR